MARTPENAPTPSHANPTHEASADFHHSSPSRVLVVDDFPDTADSLAHFLQISGFDVRTAYDGASAVSEAAAFRPHAVLLDIGLPGVSGYEAAQRIRALPGGPDILLMALTGWGQDEDRRKIREAGFDHHLIKPVNPTTITSILANLSGVTRLQPPGIG